MKKLLSTLCAATMAMTAVATTSVATQAAPVVPMVRGDVPTSDVEQVQYRRHGYYRNGGNHYYNGHRGYRAYRPGYQRHGDYWFPAGAFIAGAIIGGALAQPAPRYYAPRRVYRSNGNSAHVQWCYDRYRSYDAYSDTYQPYGGPRRTCYSPYN
jgi:hypothetical protein